jgi:DNA-binding transcriptional MocR family regulator
MLKREILWRQIADDVLEGRRTTFHQRALAAELGMSAGNVNLALEPLRAVGAVSVAGKNLVVRDVRKILLSWAARRGPSRPLAAFTSAEHARDLVRVLPPGLALTSFAGFVARYGDEPAPFSVARAYVRADDHATLVELRRRFSESPDVGAATLIVHEADSVMAHNLPEIVGPAQLYVDLWMEADFFASDYLRALEGRLAL